MLFEWDVCRTAIVALTDGGAEKKDLPDAVALNVAHIGAASRGETPYFRLVSSVVKQGRDETVFGISTDGKYSEGKEGAASSGRHRF